MTTLRITVAMVGTNELMRCTVNSPIRDEAYAAAVGCRRLEVALNRMEWEWAKAHTKTRLSVERFGLEDL